MSELRLPTYSLKVWVLSKRQGPMCVYCRRRRWKVVEHMFPRCRGGDDGFLNLVLACTPCNASKSFRTPLEWFMGITPVRSQSVSEEFPVVPVPDPPVTEVFMTTGDLEKYLSLSRRTLYRKIQRGLPYERAVGRYLFRRSAIDGWIAANTERKRKELNGNG